MKRINATHSDDEFAAVHTMIERIVGERAQQFVLHRIDSNESGCDRFTVSGSTGQIMLGGTSTSAVSSAFNWWLKQVAKGHISWQYDQLGLPLDLEPPGTPVSIESPFRVRFHGCPTWLGYSSPYWDWARWERELDYFAVSGYNHLFVTVGHELVYYDLLRAYGYSESEALAWIPLPAHQPWWWLDNMSNTAEPISMDLMVRRVELGRRIMDRMRELGITAVIPPFLGFVPVDFGSRHGDAELIDQGDWIGIQRPALLNPSSSLFAEMADVFYARQEHYFGVGGTCYSGEFLCEGGQIGNLDLAKAAAAAQAAMQRANPGAVWFTQAWMGNPRRELVDGLDASRVCILDLQSDVDPLWRRNAFWGAPWAWGTLSNGGGTHGLYGRLAALNSDLPEALTDPTAGQLIGAHFQPEGIGQNPVVADFMADLFWRRDPVDLSAWITAYADRRYGRPDPKAQTAWQLLLATAYSDGRNRPGGVATSADSLFNAEPALTASKASNSIGDQLHYDPASLVAAWRALLDAGEHVRMAPTYRYDLIDVTRQVVENAARALLPRIRSAYESADQPQFRQLSRWWLDLILLLDRLLGTDERFMLGPWLAYARSSAECAADQAALEYDARSIITVWVNRPNRRLRDYANRSWQGLLGDYYHDRWRRYFETLNAALAGGHDPETIDWFEEGDAWCRKRNTFPVKASGDAWEMACTIWETMTQNQMLVHDHEGPQTLVRSEQPMHHAAGS